MKLVWHIFKKDLRRLWLPLLGWGVIIMLQYFAWHGSRDRDWADKDSWLAMSDMLLWGLHLVVAWLLVPQLIQADPVIGDDAAWRSRPISGGRLLAAKALGGALMLCVWPSLLTLPWWKEFGFGAGEIVHAMAVNALGMALIMGVAAMLAVLTDSLARYLAWSAVLVVAVGLGGLMLAAGMPSKVNGVVSAAVLFTRASLAGGIVVLAVVVVIPLQYLRRRTELARRLAAGLALTAALVVQFWPWSSAQMLATTGLERYSLPTVSARLGSAIIYMPSGTTRPKANVVATVEFPMKGLAPGDLVAWPEAEPRWHFGDTRWSDLPAYNDPRPQWQKLAEAVSRGETEPQDQAGAMGMTLGLPGLLGTKLRNGEGVLSASHYGAVWRMEPGLSITLRASATAVIKGLRQVHVKGLKENPDWISGHGADVWWLDTGPLYEPAAFLENLNPDGVHMRRFDAVLVQEGTRARPDTWEYIISRNYLPAGRIPVGVLGVTIRGSNFDTHHWQETAWGEGQEITDAIREGATFTAMKFHEAAPLVTELPETAVVSDLIFEGRLEDVRRRAKDEDKLAFIWVQPKQGGAWPSLSSWSWAPELRELLRSRFVCADLTWEEGASLRKSTDQNELGMWVILKPDGQEQDRLRLLAGNAFRLALRANADGKTYASVLAEALAAKGGEDRQLRFRLHDALRTRGDLAGAFDAVLWMFDHPAAPFEGTSIFEVGWRIQRFVQVYGPAKAALLDRREMAIANLRRDPRNEGAARLLFSITLGLQQDGPAWREFPRLMPRDNPLWWEFMRNWIARSVSDKNYNETVEAVNLEKFFAEGPAWVREQLLHKRALIPGQEPASAAMWQKQLVRTGQLCVEALARSGQADAAARLAFMVLRVDSSGETRRGLSNTLWYAGAKEQAKQVTQGKIYGN